MTVTHKHVRGYIAQTNELNGVMVVVSAIIILVCVSIFKWVKVFMRLTRGDIPDVYRIMDNVMIEW